MRKSFSVSGNYEVWELVDDVLQALETAKVDFITVGQRASFGWDEDYFDVHLGWYTDKEINDFVKEFAYDIGCEPEEITVTKNKG